MSLANGESHAELPSPVRRFFAETPPIESYEMLVQEMARVTRTGVHVVVFVHGFQVSCRRSVFQVRTSQGCNWKRLFTASSVLAKVGRSEVVFEPPRNL
jgi:predicted deacetylase